MNVVATCIFIFTLAFGQVHNQDIANQLNDEIGRLNYKVEQQQKEIKTLKLSYSIPGY